MAGTRVTGFQIELRFLPNARRELARQGVACFPLRFAPRGTAHRSIPTKREPA